jgi:membrane-bound lytic murein transglycosylase B
MKKIVFILIFPIFLFASGEDSFIKKMVQKHGFNSQSLQTLFSKASVKPKILKIYNTPFRAYKNDASWTTYKSKIITKKKIQRAKVFIKKYKKQLLKAEKIYQVPHEYIVAFIGVETNFGVITGKENIFDALTTLSFYKNRKKKFFTDELESFLVMCKDKGINPLTQKGSFAGAMGCVQQLPSVHLKYGVDFNEDGDKNLFDMKDCIGTIANFMHVNGWDSKKVVTVRALFGKDRYKGLTTGYNKLYSLKELKKHNITPTKELDEDVVSLLQLRGKTKDELWLGAKNFRVLTTYNNSTNYGMAIFQIAQRLMK